MAVNLQQQAFRFREDNGSETSASWIAAKNTNITREVNTPTNNFRIRIVVYEAGTTSITVNPRLYVQKNSAGGYVQVTTDAIIGVKVVDSANFADGTATTKQVTTSAYSAGTMDDVDGMCASRSLSYGFASEHEYMLQLTASQLSNGDYFEFREYNSTSPFNSYTYTGKLTIQKAEPVTVNSDKSSKILGELSTNDSKNIKVYGGYEEIFIDHFNDTVNKDVVNTTAKWSGDGEITLQ